MTSKIAAALFRVCQGKRHRHFEMFYKLCGIGIYCSLTVIVVSLHLEAPALVLNLGYVHSGWEVSAAPSMLGIAGTQMPHAAGRGASPTSLHCRSTFP